MKQALITFFLSSMILASNCDDILKKITQKAKSEKIQNFNVSHINELSDNLKKEIEKCENNLYLCDPITVTESVFSVLNIFTSPQIYTLTDIELIRLFPSARKFYDVLQSNYDGYIFSIINKSAKEFPVNLYYKIVLSYYESLTIFSKLLLSDDQEMASEIFKGQYFYIDFFSLLVSGGKMENLPELDSYMRIQKVEIDSVTQRNFTVTYNSLLSYLKRMKQNNFFTFLDNLENEDTIYYEFKESYKEGLDQDPEFSKREGAKFILPYLNGEIKRPSSHTPSGPGRF